MIDRLREFDRAIDATGTVRSLSVLRLALGPIVVLHLQDYLRDGLDGVVYSDRYYLPYATWYPEAPAELYLVMLSTAVVTAACMSIGLFTRVTAGYTAFFVAYNIFLSRTHFAHNRVFLLILLLTVAVVPTGRHLSIDARRRHRADRRVALWPLWLVQFEVCTVYLASATSKVIDQDFWSGLVLQRRAIDNRALAVDQGAPAWAMDLLADGTFQWWFSKGAVLSEFVIGLGFLHRRTRLLAIWVAIPFHLAIQVFTRVQVFSWAALAALTIWVTPVDRDRTLHVGPESRSFGVWVKRLDWFGRFEIVESADGLRVDDRRGVTLTGTEARLLVLSRLPLTFWFVLPRLVAKGVGTAAVR